MLLYKNKLLVIKNMQILKIIRNKYFLISVLVFILIGVIVWGGVFMYIKFQNNSSAKYDFKSNSHEPGEVGEVKKIIDPITIQLTSGHIIRYVGVRNPDVTAEVRCFGKEALLANESMIGEKVRMEKEPLINKSNDGAWVRYVFIEDTASEKSQIPNPKSQTNPNEQNPKIEIEGQDNQAPKTVEPVENKQLDASKDNNVEQKAPEKKEILVNERILEMGLGFPLVSQEMKYGERMISSAKYASATGKGLWSQCKVDSKQTANGTYFTTQILETCIIKGKINIDGKKIYRTPECPAYVETMVILAEGGKWFCAEDTAREEGFVKAEDCK